MSPAPDRRQVLGAALMGGALSAAPAPAEAGAPRSGACDAGPSARQPVVATATGKVRGFESRNVRIFYGIPYGAPTDGENRFQPPRPPKSWAGVRDCLVYGPQCPVVAGAIQKPGAPEGPEETFMLYRNSMRPVQSEDCLRLNVWAPSRPGKRPVMVYMHGGGYFAGSGHELLAYDGLNLAERQDVVVVTHNHRLNVFGYLDLSSFGGRWAQSANLGMQDIVAVLRWVRDNIAEFGGDPGNVTIFGQSGGGGKVQSLMAMPSAKGLFHRAIVQSGAMSSMTGMTRAQSRKQAESALSTLGVTASDLDRLGKLPVETVCNAVFTGGGPMGWRPVADGTVLMEPGHPDSLAPGVPLVVGTVLNELTHSLDNPKREGFDDAALARECAKSYGADAPAIIASYAQSHPDHSPFELWCAMQAASFRSGSYDLADRKFAVDGKVWQYLFTWRTPMLEGRPKTFHSCEISFVFDNADLCANQTGGGPGALDLADRISSAWAALARRGDPNHKRLPNWPACGPDHPTMLFDTPCRIVRDPEAEGRRLIAKARLRAA